MNKRHYEAPCLNQTETKIRTSLLGSSNIRPDGTQRPAGTDGVNVGGGTTVFDAKRRNVIDF